MLKTWYCIVPNPKLTCLLMLAFHFSEKKTCCQKCWHFHACKRSSHIFQSKVRERCFHQENQLGYIKFLPRTQLLFSYSKRQKTIEHCTTFLFLFVLTPKNALGRFAGNDLFLTLIVVMEKLYCIVLYFYSSSNMMDKLFSGLGVFIRRFSP